MPEAPALKYLSHFTVRFPTSVLCCFFAPFCFGDGTSICPFHCFLGLLEVENSSEETNHHSKTPTLLSLFGSTWVCWVLNCHGVSYLEIERRITSPPFDVRYSKESNKSMDH